MSKLRYRRKDFTDSDKFDMARNIIEREYEIYKEKKRDNLKLCYDLLKRPSKNGIPLSYPSMYIISSALDKNIIGEIESPGLYREMGLTFHNQPGLGHYKTILRMPEEPKYSRRLGYIYNFEAKVLQESKTIVFGKLKCISKEKFNI